MPSPTDLGIGVVAPLLLPRSSVSGTGRGVPARLSSSSSMTKAASKSAGSDVLLGASCRSRDPCLLSRFAGDSARLATLLAPCPDLEGELWLALALACSCSKAESIEALIL